NSNEGRKEKSFKHVGRFEPYSNPARKYRVLITNVPFDVKWQALKDLAKEKVGEVTYVELLMDAEGKSRVNSTVEFRTEESMKKAADVLNRYDMNGRPLKVKIDPDGEHARKIVMKTFGGPGGMGPNMGVAPGMINIPPNIMDNPNMVNLIQALQAGRLGSTIFVANLDYKVGWKKLKEVFSMAGTVVRADVLEDKSGKSRGMGTVSFEQPVEAVQAISMFNSQLLFDKPMHVKMDEKSMPRSDSFSQDRPQLPRMGMDAMGYGGMNKMGGRRLGSFFFFLFFSDIEILIECKQSVGQGGGQCIIGRGFLCVCVRAFAGMESSYGGGMDGLSQFSSGLNRMTGGGMNMSGNMGMGSSMDRMGLGMDRMSSGLDRMATGVGSGIDRMSQGMGTSLSLSMDRSGLDRMSTCLDMLDRMSSNIDRMGTGMDRIGSGLERRSFEMDRIGSGMVSDIDRMGAMGMDRMGSGMDRMGNIGMGLGGVERMGTGMGVGNVSASMVSGMGSAMGLAMGGGFDRSMDMDRTAFGGNYGTSMAGGASAGLSRKGCQIFVRNLPFDFTWKKLKDEFNECGRVQYAEIKMENGKSKGCGVVRFESPQVAERACRLMNGIKLNGREIDVRLDRNA
uniref:Heteroous nuclear ribonucleoprotein M n=1 Tax=Latimeria chalumnae TaxID=7897 RepID=H3BB40_LATCH